jgi:superfamily II DNA or RNA helicase
LSETAQHHRTDSGTPSQGLGAPSAEKDSTARPLRAWQRRALTKYLTTKPQDFLAVATPGAGKTVFGLRIAAELLSDRTVEAVTIVTPTEHLKHQWAEAAAFAGIAIDPNFRNTTGATSSDFRGVAVTYAQVAAHPTLHRVRTENRKTLVILDEIHPRGAQARADRDALPQRRLADPVHHLRAGRRGPASQQSRPLVRVRRRAGRWCRPAGGLPRLLG